MEGWRDGGMEILSRGDALRVLTFTKEEAVGKRAQVVGGSVFAGQCLRSSGSFKCPK